MSEFYDYLDEILGSADALTDIRATVRRCWFYDFLGYPFYVWQGKGRLHTVDANGVENIWLGSIDANDNDHHKTPRIQDGRDGSSATLEMSLDLIDVPNQPVGELYEALRSEQSRVSGRKVICYLALFKEGEGLRPSIPIIYFKEFIMISPKFSEKIEGDPTQRLTKSYRTSVICKDGNYGRSNVPGGTYADTIQKQRALELGVSVDKGSEYLALLANRTYQLP